MDWRSSTRWHIASLCQSGRVCMMCSTSAFSSRSWARRRLRLGLRRPPRCGVTALEVLKSRVSRGVRQLLIRWDGLSASATSWEDLDDFRSISCVRLEGNLFVERKMLCGAFHQASRYTWRSICMRNGSSLLRLVSVVSGLSLLED